MIEYITIASTGNASDFGNLLSATTAHPAGAASNTRGIFAGGGSSIDVIQYITIASTGNASDFGDLVTGRANGASNSSKILALFAGGDNSGALNSINKITIASTGNATDSGDLLAANTHLQGCSNGHGGL